MQFFFMKNVGNNKNLSLHQVCSSLRIWFTISNRQLNHQALLNFRGYHLNSSDISLSKSDKLITNRKIKEYKLNYKGIETVFVNWTNFSCDTNRHACEFILSKSIKIGNLIQSVKLQVIQLYWSLNDICM